MIKIDYKKLVSNFRKQGNEVRETTRLKSVLPTTKGVSIKEQINAKIAAAQAAKQAAVEEKITDCNDPEYIIENHNCPDFGKKVKDTVAYKTAADLRKQTQEKLDAAIAKAKLEVVPNVKEDLDLIARDSQRGYVVEKNYSSFGDHNG